MAKFRVYFGNKVAATAPTSHIKSINGVDRANIKSRNGVPIGNIKSVNGVE